MLVLARSGLVRPRKKDTSPSNLPRACNLDLHHECNNGRSVCDPGKETSWRKPGCFHFWIFFGPRFPRFGPFLAVSGETVVIFCISDMEASRYTEYRPILMENRSRYGRFRKFIRNLFFSKSRMA